MKPRHAFDAMEAARVKPVAEPLGGLFAPVEESTVPRWAESWGSLTDDERKAQRERWKELLLPIVLELAQRDRPPGVTWSEVVAAGISRKILWGERPFLTKYPRVYAWGGAWLSSLATRGLLKPKLVRLPEGGTLHVTREADRTLSHGNRNGVYLDPKRAA